MDTVVAKVGEYEGLPVEIVCDATTGRLLVRAFNEGAHNQTCVDLVDVIEWAKANRPDLLQQSEPHIR